MKRLAALFGVALLATALGAQIETPPPPPPQEPVAVDANAVRREAFAAELRGDHTAAADAFLQLGKLEPTEPNWVERAADNLGKSGRFNDALELLEASISRFPDVISLRSMLARTYHLKADTMRAQGVFDANVVFHYEDAVRAARKVLAMDPRHLEARLIVASARYQLADYDGALAEAEQAVEQNPDAYGGHAMVGRIVFQRFVEARGQVDAATLGAEERARLRDAAARDGERARAAFQAAAKADPTRAFPQVKLGDLAAWEGDLDDALEWYGKALVIDPQSQVDHGWLRTGVDADRRREFYGTVKARYAQRPDATPAGAAVIGWYEAQAAFDQAANAPADASPKERTQAYGEAAKLFAAALEALPDYVDTYWWLMQSRYWGGDVPGAAEVAVQFAERDPQRFADMIRGDEQTVAALIGMAAAAYSAGRLADSRELNRVIAYAKQTADAWNNYAFLCRETRQYEDSLRAYEHALTIEPESPQLMNDAAVILQYHLTGDDAHARAKQYYESAIRLAERQIASGELSSTDLERARVALRDARNNLSLMR